MRKTARLVATAVSTVALLGSLALTPISLSAADEKKTEVKKTPLEEGKEIASNRAKGNCLACHTMGGGESPGNIGPPLMGMKRFSREKLREQIGDPTKRNPNSSMPPYGKHKILNDDELDKVTDYVHTL